MNINDFRHEYFRLDIFGPILRSAGFLLALYYAANCRQILFRSIFTKLVIATPQKYLGPFVTKLDLILEHVVISSKYYMYWEYVLLRLELLKALNRLEYYLMYTLFSLKRLIFIRLGQIVQGLPKSHKACPNRTRLAQIAHGLDKSCTSYGDPGIFPTVLWQIMQALPKSHKACPNRTRLGQIMQAIFLDF